MNEIDCELPRRRLDWDIPYGYDSTEIGQNFRMVLQLREELMIRNG